MFKREFIKKEDWKESYLFVRYILPFLVVLGTFNIAMGNRDSTFVFITAVIFLVFVITYTKRRGTFKKPKSKNKNKLIIRYTIEIILIVVGLSILYDDVRYNIGITQVQFQNEGYVTGQMKVGDKKGADMILEEKEGDIIYWHVFDGYKYLSKIEAKGTMKEWEEYEDDLD